MRRRFARCSDSAAVAGRRVRGDFYAFLRVVGTIAMCVAVGLIAFFTPLWLKGIEEDAIIGVASVR